VAATRNSGKRVRETKEDRVKSTEQVAKAAFDALPTSDKMLVLPWRELGNTWEDSMVNSGVLSGPLPSTPYRITPAEAERQRRIDQINEQSLARRIRNLLPDECSRRYEASHHEAAHGIVVMALGKPLRSIQVNSDNPAGGLCTYGNSGVTPLETATIAVAGMTWIEQVYYKQFRYYIPSGATGCDSDIRRAQAAVGTDMNWELGRAFRLAKEILRDNFDETEALADALDRDGVWFPSNQRGPARGRGHV
jgi:hypothetical protein